MSHINLPSRAATGRRRVWICCCLLSCPVCLVLECLHRRSCSVKLQVVHEGESLPSNEPENGKCERIRLLVAIGHRSLLDHYSSFPLPWPLSPAQATHVQERARWRKRSRRISSAGYKIQNTRDQHCELSSYPMRA